MTPDSLRSPEALLREISRDLHPVRPAPLPSRMALRMALVAVLAAFAVLTVVGLRKDVGALGPFVTWGASAAQITLSLILIWIAVRESTPARRLSRIVVYSALAASWLAVVAFALWTFSVSPAMVLSTRSERIAWLVCPIGGTVAGSLVVTSFAWLFRYSLAARPGLMGALYGLGVGMTMNAGWRLACPISSPWHFATAHGPAILATSLIGAFAARSIAKRARGLK
jgi:hypothetical protein